MDETQAGARQVYEDYRADKLTAADAARQLAELLGSEAEAKDEKLDALLGEIQVLTTLPCVVTATAATSCSRWCS